MSNRNNNICGPKCRFKLLYEGTQASLADIASSSVSQARRVAHLRTGMMGILRAAAPRRFSELEKHLGCRVSEVDDDTFLSCVQWLLESNRDEISLSMLRAELSGAGFSWALETTPAALLKVVQDGRVNKTPAAPDTSNKPTQPSASDPVAEEAISDEAPKVEAEPLDDLFAGDHSECPTEEETPPTPKERVPPRRKTKKKSTSNRKADQPELDVDAAGLLSQVLGDEPQPSPTPNAAKETKEELASESLEPEKPTDSEPVEEEEVFAGDAMFGGDDTPVDFSDDFLDSPVSEEFDDTFGDLDDAFASLEPADSPAEPEPQPEPQPEPEPEPEPQPAPVRREVRSAADKFSPFAGVPGAGKAKAKTTPVRPKRKPAISATAPAAEVEADVELRLRPLALVPRPTFVSDLISVVGDAAKVDAWVEAERLRQRETGDSEFKFINVKDRYSDRGSLVIPESSARELMDPSGTSWWLACLRHFSGARLVEIAILLHSLGDGISKVDVSEDGEAVTILAQSQRGSGGVTAIVVSTRVDGTVSPTVVEAVSSLAGGHFEMIMVLHTHDEEFESFVSAIGSELAQAGLQNAPMPIAASLNRCYAERDFSSVRQLLS